MAGPAPLIICFCVGRAKVRLVIMEEHELEAGALFADLLASLPTEEDASLVAQASLTALSDSLELVTRPESSISSDGELLRADPTLLDALCAPAFALDGALASEDSAFEAETAARTQLRDGEAARELASRELAPSLAATSKLAARRSDPNKARAEQRRELLSLRSQAEEMEKQLEEMRARQTTAMSAMVQKPPAPEVHAGDSENDKEETDTKFTDVWRQVCLRQLERRLQAERENAMLRDAVLSRMRVTGAINAALQGSPREESIGVISRKRALSLGAPPSNPEVDREIFAQLLADVDSDIYKVDEFMDDNALVDCDSPHQGTQVRQTGGRLVLDVFVSSLLPFDWRTSSFAAWRLYKGPGKHYGPVYDKMVQVQRTFSLKLDGCELKLTRHAAHFNRPLDPSRTRSSKTLSLRSLLATYEQTSASGRC